MSILTTLFFQRLSTWLMHIKYSFHAPRQEESPSRQEDIEDNSFDNQGDF